MNHSPFDKLAKTYDQNFSDTKVGRMQRETVWKYLEKIINNLAFRNILETGCGTGEDAIFLAGIGAEIWASDPSVQMLNVAARKAEEKGYEQKIHFTQNGFENWKADFPDQKFQIFLANFGCLNCLPPEKLKAGFRNIHSCFPAGSRAILVVIPPFSLFETLGFLSRFNFKKAFRRWGKQPKQFDVNGLIQNVWYYSPKDILEIVGQEWTMKNKIPLGFFLPPGGMNSVLMKNNTTARLIAFLENLAVRARFLSGYSDHFLIDLEKEG